MTDSYQGGPSRPLPPYRPAADELPPAPVAHTFQPVPSQSSGRPPAASAFPARHVRPGTTFAPTDPPPAPVPPSQRAPMGPPAAVGQTTVMPPAAGQPPAVQRTAVMPATPPQAPAAPARPAAGGPAARAGSGPQRQPDDIDIDEVLRAMVAAGGSDLHLTTGAPPTVRISGSLKALEGFPPMAPEPLRRSIYAMLTQKNREKFEANLELDISHAVRGLARFRVNVYQQRESIGAAFRVIPYEIKELKDLGVPPIVGTFAGMPRGLVLVTGPTGSGKSTTLASIVDLANRTREDHIMTVEDPIEFLHRHKKCVVNQREVGADTHSFANALKHVLRQDPDIILVGEMRDLETISVALTAAETGHLVFATLHTQDAAQTIDRIIDVFPSHQQAQVRTQLAGALQGVVCQTLVKRSDGPGRAVATEVLIATPAIRNLIREGKTHQIYSSMQAGAQQGMHTLDQHLADLVKTNRISYEAGLEACHHVEDYNRLTGRFSGGSQGMAGMGGMDPYASMDMDMGSM